jgi:hypothetical protein
MSGESKMTESKPKPVVIALLQTRCGCAREMVIPFPYPQTLYIPLMPDFRPTYDADTAEQLFIKERLFDLDRWHTESDRTIYVAYKERL